MKRVNYIIALAACLAALLTSCIKEEAYTLDTLDLQVNVTRAGATSEQQGDQIEDIMIWAFPYNSGGAIEDKAEGWRTYKPSPSTPTYTSVSVHIPLPMCNGEAKNYRLVAIINKDKFGTIVKNDGSALTLDQNTTYPELINARFTSQVENEDLNKDEWGNILLNKPGSPATMPVSHWKDVEVTNASIYPNKCLQVEMPVFRALAKTQLFVARNNAFEIDFPSLQIINAETENLGAVLAEPAAGWSVINGVDTPDWFTTATMSKSNYSVEFIDEPAKAPKLEEGDSEYVYDDNSILVNAEDGHDVANYLCGKILYETAGSCTYNDPTYKSVPTGNGYYYKISYRIGKHATSDTDTDTHNVRYVPLPPIARNHDYQVRAFIKEDGGIEVSYTVADWEDNEAWDLAFDAAQNSELLPLPSKNSKPEENQFAAVSYTQGSEDGAAKLFFQMEGPGGITWKPTILNASQDHYITRVYEVIPLTEDAEGNIVTYELSSEPVEGDIEADPKKFYCVKVIALDPTAHEARTEPIKLGITHAPQWNDEKSNLLVVNPKDSDENYFWYGKDTSGNPSKKVGDELMVYIYPEK